MPTATDYFKQLCDVMLSMRVTDREGSLLPLDHGTQAAARMLLLCRDAQRKVMLVGNGGSAGIASHMANDLLKAVGLRAMVFTDASTLTAYTNDHGYETAYARQIDQWAEPDDLLIAVSSSGGSANILRACEAAEHHRAAVLTFSGFDPKNPLRRMGLLNFYVPAFEYGPVEMAHAVLGHCLTDTAAALSQPTTLTTPQENHSHDRQPPDTAAQPLPAPSIQTTGSGHWWSRLRRGRVSA